MAEADEAADRGHDRHPKTSLHRYLQAQPFPSRDAPSRTTFRQNAGSKIRIRH
ncbi:hypothetical protein ABZ590_19770 [Streptomyces hirsutus]|uniref:hypothetical protein n=1 Tax=Streptomyces hirsutus TaxID=35620 RepID=UPI0033F9AFF5